MFCMAKSAKKNKNKFARRFETTSKQKCSNLRPLLWITFPQGFRIFKNFGHQISGSGGKKTFQRYLKSEQTNRQPDRHTDIWTYRKLWKVTPEYKLVTKTYIPFNLCENSDRIDTSYSCDSCDSSDSSASSDSCDQTTFSAKNLWWISTQIVMKLKNSHFAETKKLKLRWNSRI